MLAEILRAFAWWLAHAYWDSKRFCLKGEISDSTPWMGIRYWFIHLIFNPGLSICTSNQNLSWCGSLPTVDEPTLVPILSNRNSHDGNNFRVTGPLCWEFTGHRWMPITKVSDAELWCFFVSAWINSWVNNHDAVDLRRHRTRYDVIVMNINHLTSTIISPQVSSLCCLLQLTTWNMLLK